MNKQDLILEALTHLLVSLDVNDPKVESTILDIHEVLNPKEVIPYKKSLEVCANCGKIESEHFSILKYCHEAEYEDFQGDMTQFVKSSINENHSREGVFGLSGSPPSPDTKSSKGEENG